MTTELVERLAEAAHEGWMQSKLADGITSRVAEWGEEFMRPYGELSEAAKEIDRSSVRAVLRAIDEAGYMVSPKR